jgi:BirA family biotin operon repressor/biotin-[acetyl-CoA-carboxylase] ligase
MPVNDSPVSRVDAARLTLALDPEARRWTIEVVEESGSTNSDLLQRARDGKLDAPVVRVAHRQTAGRGRQGRQWLGGTGLAFSLAWPLPLPQSALSGLSLVCGLALADGLADYDGRLAAPVWLKWPNDALLDGRKLAGILVETVKLGADRTGAVIGIGLNLARPVALEVELQRTIAGIDEVAPLADASLLLACVLNQLARLIDHFVRDGFAPLAPRWSERDAYRGQTVRLLHDGKLVLEGVARGVDDTGQLLVETPEGVMAMSGGELSLRTTEPA